MKKRTILHFWLAAALLLASVFCYAQSGHGRGRLAGTVVDEAGSPVSGATIGLEFTGEGLKTETITNQKGEWAFMGLGTGLSTLTVRADGYMTVKLKLTVQQLIQNPEQRIVMKKEAAAKKPEEKDAESAPQKAKDGYALLDSLISAFQGLSQVETGEDVLEAQLIQIVKDTIHAREVNQIDALFYFRMRRMLTVIRLIMTPDKGLLMPLIEREIGDFVMSTTGEALAGLKGPNALGKIAGALEEEIISLQLYLDSRETREKLKKKFEQRFPAH